MERLLGKKWLTPPNETRMKHVPGPLLSMRAVLWKTLSLSMLITLSYTLAVTTHLTVVPNTMVEDKGSESNDGSEEGSKGSEDSEGSEVCTTLATLYIQ